MGAGGQGNSGAGSIAGGSQGGVAEGVGRNGMGLVCVTGGTGLIASNIVRRLLQLGYTVRATVRNPQDKKKTAILWNLEGANERLSIVGADLLQEGSFDAALEGVEGVFHTAGPVLPEDPNNPQATMIDPTVNGALNVLRSCAKSSTMRKIVMTSSCSAVRYDYGRSADDPPLDESSWSNVDYCKDHQMWYAIAKTQAEQEAWKFSQEHNLNLVVVNPSFVVGPFLGDFPSSTVSYIYYVLHGKIEEYTNQILGFVHIDDVVEAHILGYEKAEASGRYICSSEVAHWEQIMDLMRSKYPAKIPTSCKRDNTEPIPHSLNTSKLQRLGLKSFKSLDQMFDDCLQDFSKKGLLPQLSCSTTPA
ncbi:unnamed protein product [Calypogeia fissa]